MLNQRVAASEFFSSFAEKIRWAIYPPPPGSAPGYQLAHQFKLIQTRNDRNHDDVQSGTKAKVFRPVTASCAAIFATSPSMPPTAATANTAKAVTMPIFK